MIGTTITNTTMMINLDNVAREQKHLAYNLNEMLTRVNAVHAHFEDLQVIAEAAKGMLYSAWSYRPLSNGIRQLTQWYLTPEQYDELFASVNVQASAAKFLKEEINEAMAGLKDSQDVEAFENALIQLNQRIVIYFEHYFNAIKDASELSATFNGLNPKLQEELDKYLKQQQKPLLGGNYGKAIQGAQHIGRIPLVLREIASSAKQNPNEHLAAQGTLLEEILKELIVPTISKQFSTKM